ncbi:MAG: DEAD/DEAH box helicase family protein [Desulfamplus sp.]|nr:DEAD/DEAH box helicase family protein [Desulfamplus sp.]
MPNIQKLQLVKMGKYAGNLPDKIAYHEAYSPLQGDKGLIVPRGAGMRAFHIVNKYHGKEISITDDRTYFEPVKIEFKGTLKQFQEDAIQAMVPRTSGILTFPTGGGKTVAMLSLIARRGQPTLVVVHSLELLYQWRDRACQFLDIQSDEIGLIGGGNYAIGDRLTIGTIQKP